MMFEKVAKEKGIQEEKLMTMKFSQIKLGLIEYRLYDTTRRFCS